MTASTRRPFLRTVAGLLVVLSLLGLLAQVYLVLSPWRLHVVIEPGQVEPTGGFAYLAPLNSSIREVVVVGDSIHSLKRSDTIVLEDGVPLGNAHAAFADIRDRGEGRFAHWGYQLTFSASDNSDPRANGRLYSVSTRASLGNRALLLLLLAGGAGVAGLALARRTPGTWSRVPRDVLAALRAPTGIGSRGGLHRVTAWTGVVAGTGLAWWLLFHAGASLSPHSVDALEGWLQAAGGVAALWLALRSVLRTESGRADAAEAGIRVEILSAVLVAGGILLFVTPVLTAWSTGQTTSMYIAGVLPYNDAGGYYAGALRLLDESSLGAWHMRRPLNAALHAVRLWITDGDLARSIALAALLTGFACLVLSRTVGRSFGLAAAVATFLWLYLYGAPFLPTTLTAVHGLLFGLLALAALWRAALDRSVLLFGLGLLLLTLGLSARSGPFLLLPALLVWGVVYLRRERGVSLTVVATGLIAIVAGFGVPALFNALWGEGDNVGQSNFAYTLYGMVAGGKGWQQIYADHPEIFERLATEGAQAKAMYEVSIQLLKEDARPFLGFVLGELARFPAFVSGGLLGGDGLAGLVFRGLSLVGLVWLALNWRERLPGMALLAIAGVWVSSPFLMMDGGARVFAAGVAFLTVPAAAGLFATIRLVEAIGGTLRDPDSAPEQQVKRRVPMEGVVGAAAAVVLVVAPLLVAGTLAAESVPVVDCPDGQRGMVVDTKTMATVVTVVPDDQRAGTWSPRVRAADFGRAPAYEPVELWSLLQTIDVPFVLIMARDRAWRRSGVENSVFWGVMPSEPGLLPSGPGGVTLLCGQVFDGPEFEEWKEDLFRLERASGAHDRP